MYNKFRQVPSFGPQIFNGLFLVWAITLIVISLAGYLGKLNIYLELASHFKVQYLIGGFCPFFFFLIQWGLPSRRQKLGAIGLILSGLCLLINLWELVPWYFPHHWWQGNVNGEELRVLLSNVNKYQDNSCDRLGAGRTILLFSSFYCFRNLSLRLGKQSKNRKTTRNLGIIMVVVGCVNNAPYRRRSH